MVELEVAEISAGLIGLDPVAPPGGETGGADDGAAGTRIETLEKKEPVGVGEGLLQVFETVRFSELVR